MPAADRAPRKDGSRILARAAPLVIAATAAVLVYHRALGYFFSQDDFLGLAQASGLAPRLVQPWRYLANQAVWDVLRPLGTAQAWPHHLLSLAVHAACVALLCDRLARRLPPWAALAGAVFFAVHPMLFATLYWFSTVGDPLALFFGLLTLRAHERSDRWRWLAVPFFVLSLLSKESLILLPVVVAVLRRWGAQPASGETRSAGRVSPPGRKTVDGLVLALAGASLAYVVYFLTLAYGAYFVSSGGSVVQAGEAARAPYALAWGANLWQNLLTYLGWTVAFALPVVRGFSDAVDPAVYPWAGGALALWLSGLFAARLRRAGWMIGGLVWLLFILPVLPLRNHTYHYYLYAPLAGAAWCVAAAFGAAFPAGERHKGRSRAPRAREARDAQRPPPAAAAGWVAAGAFAALLTLNGVLLVRKIETMPFVLPELRAEPIVDRARIARNVQESLSAASLPPGVSLRFWSPTAASLGPRGEPLGSPAPVPTYWERNVQNALLDGLAVRVLFPRVNAVRFVREFRPTPPDEWYAVYRPDGRVRVATSAEVDSILRMRAATP